MKVFCGGCKHFYVFDLRPDYYDEQCINKKNRFANYKHSEGMMKRPDELNRDNDCGWFEKREKEKK